MIVILIQTIAIPPVGKGAVCKPGDLRRISRTYVKMEGERKLLKIALWFPHTWCGMPPTHIMHKQSHNTKHNISKSGAIFLKKMVYFQDYCF